MEKKICENCGRPLDRGDIKYCKLCVEDKDYYKNKEEIARNKEYYSNNTSNSTATAVKIIGWLEIIGGVILGIILGNVFENRYGDFNFGACVGAIAGSIITGVFILGFAEIIQLLQDIKDKL